MLWIWKLSRFDRGKEGERTYRNPNEQICHADLCISASLMAEIEDSLNSRTVRMKGLAFHANDMGP